MISAESVKKSWSANNPNTTSSNGGEISAQSVKDTWNNPRPTTSAQQPQQPQQNLGQKIVSGIKNFFTPTPTPPTPVQSQLSSVGTQQSNLQKSGVQLQPLDIQPISAEQIKNTHLNPQNNQSLSQNLQGKNVTLNTGEAPAPLRETKASQEAEQSAKWQRDIVLNFDATTAALYRLFGTKQGKSLNTDQLQLLKDNGFLNPNGTISTGRTAKGMVQNELVGLSLVGGATMLANPATIPAMLKTMAEFTVVKTAIDKTIMKKIKDIPAYKTSSQSTKDWIDVIEIVGEAVAVGAIQKYGPKAIDYFTKQEITNYNLPKTVTLDPTQVRDIYQTGKLTTVEEQELYGRLGLTSTEARNAINSGVKIDIPTEKVVSIVDRSWWAKVKGVFGLPEATPEVTKGFGGVTIKQAPAGLLAGVGENPIPMPPITPPTTEPYYALVKPDEVASITKNGLQPNQEGYVNLVTKAGIDRVTKLGSTSGKSVLMEVRPPTIDSTTKDSAAVKGVIPPENIKVIENVNQPKVVSKPLEPLAQEARKYGSAEEFVKNNVIEMPLDKSKPRGGLGETTDPLSYDKLTTTTDKSPIKLKYTLTDGTWTIIDGNTRIRTALANGDKTIKANVSFWRPQDAETFFNQSKGVGVEPLAQEMVTLYHASPDMPTKGNWRKGTMFADTEQNARYYAESHHRGNITVEKVEVPKSLVEKNKTNNIYNLKEEYPVNQSKGVGVIEKGGRNLMEIENGDLTLPELKSKISIAIEGKEDPDLINQIKKDIASREKPKIALAPKPKVVIKPKVVSVPRTQLPVGKETKVASTLEARVRKTLDNVSQEQIDRLGLSTYKQMTNESQIKQASDYVIKNPDEALKVLQGDIEPPKGLLKNSIYVAAVNNATDNISLMTKLASLQSTRFGQEIEILKEINKNSPVKFLDQVIKFRADAVQKKLGKPVEKSIGDEVTKIKKEIKAPTKWDWNTFIDSIEC